MYQVSNSFLQAMDDISRTLAVEVEISGVSYPTDTIIRFELERGAFDNDVFTIGQTLSNVLTLEIFTTPTIQTGDEIKLYTSLRVGEKDERVPLGVYYVDSTRVNKEKMTLTCYDKMVTFIDEYIPSSNHTTLAALFEDVLSQIGMRYEGTFHDAPIKQTLYGYTYRETLGFIASLNGGNMVVNRAGHLEIQRFQTVERTIPAKACFSFDVKEPYRVSKVFCQFGDVGIIRGDSGGQCVAFENPYVTEQNIDAIYRQLNGLSFTAATLNYRGDLTLDPGDIFQFTDYKGDIYPLMCGRNKLTFNGGLSGQLDSIGESENTNSYAESQLKYKKNITKVTAELGKIQALVQEIEQSHDGLEERVEKAELEITADAIKSKVEDVFVAKDEISGLVTEEQLQSAITQSAESITTQVSNTYETKEEVTHKLNDAQSIAKAMQDGKILYPDATFKESYNDFSIYNNAFNGSVTIERIPKPYDCPTTSTHCIKIKHTGQGEPGHGGFCQIINSRPNAVFIQKIIAKLPPGRRLMLAHNPLGDGATDRWLTSSVGTGNWEEYIRETRCGSTGTFSSGGYVYVSNGDTPSHSNPLEWYVASCTVVDITDVDDRVSNLTGRINEAEQKITPEAITNTVKDHFYTKEETDAQITSQGYQTASEVQQTVDQLQIKFTQSGGYNFVRNGNAKNGQAHWHPYYLPECSWGIRNDLWTGYEPAIEIYAPNSATTTNAVYQIVDGLIQGETYTVSALVAGHRGSNRIIIVNGEGTAEIGWSDEATDCYGGIYYDNWKRISGTFKATSDSCQLRLCHYNGWGNSYGWFKQIQVNRGSIPLPYSPNPSEIYDGITTIDKDGIKVSTNKGSYTHFSADGMDSYDNNGNMTLGLRNGGMTFHAWNDHEYVGYISQSAASSSGYNGVSLGMTPLGDYLSLGVSSNATDPNAGFSQQSYFAIAPHGNHDTNKTGINMYKDLHMHGWTIDNAGRVNSSVFYSTGGVKIKGAAGLYFDSDATYSSMIWEGSDDGILRMFGDNGIIMGYLNGSASAQCFHIKETKDGLGCRIGMYDHLNMNGWRIKNATVNNCSFRLDEFSRTSSDYVSIFKASTSSKSEMNIELANDYVTWFNIQANNYADGGRYIACFNYQNGGAASNVGVHFYRAMNCHGYNITNVGNMSVYSVRSEELEVNDIRVSTPFSVMSRNGEQTSLSVTKSIDDLTEANGTVTMTHKQVKVELPQGLVFTDYYVQVTGNKLAKLAVTERTEEYFVIETDSDEELDVFYTIKAFQPQYVTRTAIYGELQGEEGIASMTYEEAMRQESVRTAKLLGDVEGDKPEDLSKPVEPQELKKDSFHT